MTTRWVELVESVEKADFALFQGGVQISHERWHTYPQAKTVW